MHRHRQAREDPAVPLAHVGQRRIGLLGGNALERVGEGQREGAPGAQVCPGAREERVAAIPAAHQLRDLHRPEYQGVIALRELERPRVRHHRLYPELPGSGSRCQRA